MVRTFSILALALLLSACHRYVPARLGEVPAGTEVRVHLTQDGARRVEASYGGSAEQLSGELHSWESEVVIAVLVPAAPGLLDRGLTNRIVLPQRDIVAIDVREPDRTRSILLGAGIAALAAGAAIAAFSGVFGGTTNSDPPLPEELLIPLWLRVFP